MSLIEFDELTVQRELDAPPIGHIRGNSRVYAIAFDMDIESLKKGVRRPV
jgi:hypothetical protein